MPLILSGNVASATADAGYSVANSCRFNFADSAYLSKTFDAAGNQKTFTLSTWIKRGRLGDLVMLYGGAAADGIYFTSGDQLLVICGSGSDDRRISTMLFRDTSAWYHIVQKFDTTQGTAADRYTLYVNGTEAATSVVGGKNEITQDLDIALFYNAASYIGFDGSADYFDGYMAETVHIDGTALAASSFGEFNEDSPNIWQPKDVSGLTFGTNGFYLDFEDSGDLGDDESGNTNDFAENNIAATDQSTDTPTLNYPTLNILQPGLSNLTISEGNLNMVSGDANYRSLPATMGATAGKWYAEFKAVSGFDSTDKNAGIYRADNTFVATTGLGNFTTGTTWSYGAQGGVRTNNGENDSEATFTDGDIIQVAMDLDNLKLYFGKNNTWINSGDPESGATGTGAYTIINAAPKEFYHFAAATISSGGAKLWSCNFGSPSYANSSDAADADGSGAFEYAPPSGYFAMNSKNLGAYGG